MRREGLGESIFWLAGGLFVLFWVGFVVLLMASGLSQTTLPLLIESLKSEEVLFATKLSLLTATGATLLSLFISLPGAYFLSRRNFPGKGLVDSFLDLPVVFPPVAAGFLLLMFFDTWLGNEMERLLGALLGRPDFRIPFTPWALVPAQFTIVCGLCMRVLKSAFDSISPRYEAVARTLGFGPFRTFVKIVLPLAKGGILAAAVLTWARAMGEFGATMTLAGAMRMETEVLPIAIYLSLAVADIKTATAVTLILIATSGIALAVVKRAGGKVGL